MKDMEKKEKGSGNPQAVPEFKGYTMEELRYQRALLMVKKEIMKERALEQTERIKKDIPVVNGKMPLAKGSGGGLLSKMMKGLDLADYLLLGFQVVRIGKKVGSIFRKR